MELKTYFAQDASGNIMPGATVMVYEAATTTLATGLQDEYGSPLANPFTADSSAKVAFYAPDGLYDITVVGNGRTVTIRSQFVSIDGADTLRDDLAANGGSALIGFRQYDSGAVATSVQAKLRESVSVLDFGADPTGVNDSLPAFNAAIASFSAFDVGFYGNGGAISVPPGTYKMSGTLWIDRCVQIVGGSSPYPYGTGVSRLSFTNAGDAIVFGWLSGTYQTPSGKIGPGALLKNLYITTTATTGIGNGIVMNCKASLEGIYVTKFKGHGIYVYAQAATNGNANNFTITNCKSFDNSKCGMFATGADANAGVITMLDTSGNGEWGIYDSSFLGNTYVGCHSSVNTSGAFKTDNANAANVFVGCYSESGQPAASFHPRTLVLGGLHGAGVNTSASQINTSSAGILTSGQKVRGLLHMGFGSNTVDENIQTFTDTSGTYDWSLQRKLGRYMYTWAGLGIAEAMQFYDRQAKPANGYARDLSAAGSPTSTCGALGITQYYMGGAGQMKYRAIGSAAPTTGDYLQGDIIFNQSPTAGGFIGWVCTASGTPGTWKTFGAISA